MSIPPAGQECLDFVGWPIVLEPSHAQLSSDAGLPAIRQFDVRVGLSQAFAQALNDPGDTDLTRVQLSRASAETSWQQNGNNIGRASPMGLQCHWQKSGDITVCHTSNLTVNATCFQCHVHGRRAGLKIRSPQGGVGSSPTFGTFDGKLLTRQPSSARRRGHCAVRFLRPLPVHPAGIAPGPDRRRHRAELHFKHLCQAVGNGFRIRQPSLLEIEGYLY